MLKLPELFRNTKKKFNEELVSAVHEAGHGAVMTLGYGLLPYWTTILRSEGAAGFNSLAFYPGWDLDIDWTTQGLEYELSHSFGGIVAQAHYTGSYDWIRASSDIESVERDMAFYDLNYKEVVRIWIKTHELIHENFDLIILAAERLYRDKVINDQIWEELLLTEKQPSVGHIT